MFKDRCGYLAVREKDRKLVFLHHRVLPKKNGFEIDHINGITSDNRPENLRYATHSQNLANSKKPKLSRPPTSKFKGVSWNKEFKKFRANIGFQGKLYFLGSFSDERQAAMAYDKKARELFGQFARCNFAEESTVLPYQRAEGHP